MAKPTLGFPSRTAAVEALLAQGCTRPAIAAQLGITSSTVCALEHSARRNNKADPQRPKPLDRNAVTLPPDVLQALRPAALRRGTDVKTLARMILVQVVGDGIIDAVLDDEEAVR